MNKKAFARLEQLTARCTTALKDPARQSLSIYRGEMWAIIGAHHEIEKQRLKRTRPDRESRDD